MYVICRRQCEFKRRFQFRQNQIWKVVHFFSSFLLLVCFTSLLHSFLSLCSWSNCGFLIWFFLFFLLILTSLKLSFESHDRKVLIGRICAQRQSPAHEIGTSDFVAWGISNLIHPSLQMDLTWNDAFFAAAASKDDAQTRIQPWSQFLREFFD